MAIAADDVVCEGMDVAESFTRDPSRLPTPPPTLAFDPSRLLTPPASHGLAMLDVRDASRACSVATVGKPQASPVPSVEAVEVPETPRDDDAEARRHVELAMAGPQPSPTTEIVSHALKASAAQEVSAAAQKPGGSSKGIQKKAKVRKAKGAEAASKPQGKPQACLGKSGPNGVPWTGEEKELFLEKFEEYKASGNYDSNAAIYKALTVDVFAYKESTINEQTKWRGLKSFHERIKAAQQKLAKVDANPDEKLPNICQLVGCGQIKLGHTCRALPGAKKMTTKQISEARAKLNMARGDTAMAPACEVCFHDEASEAEEE